MNERNFSGHGFWLLIADEEPNLDIDLSLASIRQPDAFPLMSKTVR